MSGKGSSAAESNGEEDPVANLVIVACIIGIMVVAALIVLSPRQEEAFTQLWLNPHKIRLSNVTAGDEAVSAILGYNSTPILTGSVLGLHFYAYASADATPNLWFPDPSGGVMIVAEGDTIDLEANYLWIDAVDLDGAEALLWEYPRSLNATAKARVIQLGDVALEDDTAKRISTLGLNATPLLTGSINGKPVYAFLRRRETAPSLWFPDPSGSFKIVKPGQPVDVDADRFIIDAVDLQGGKAMLWEYGPQTRRDVRFSFVIENNEGADHDYTANVTFIQGKVNTTKLVREIPIPADARRVCTMAFFLTPEELKAIGGGNYSKVSIRLDTGQEVFFWIGATA